MARPEYGGRVSLTALNVLDGLIIIILGWNLVRGFNKGFVEEILSIVGIILSLILAYKISPYIANLLVKKPDKTTVMLAGGFVFLLSYVTVKYLAHYINRKLNETALGILNNILGFLFGIVRGWLLASIVVFVVAVLTPDGYLIKRSSLGGIAVPVVDRALKLLPIKNQGEDPIVKNWLKAEKFLRENFALNRYLKGEKSSPTRKG